MLDQKIYFVYQKSLIVAFDLICVCGKISNKQK